MKKEEVRKVLGAAAGGLAGAKVGKDTTPKHPLLGGAGGSFVGAVAGLFSAELVNALAKIGRRDDQGRAEDDRASKELESREMRGLMRGMIFMKSMSMGIIEILIAMENAEDKASPEAPVSAEALLRGQKQNFIAEFERKMRHESEIVTRILPELHLDVEEDIRFMKVYMEWKIGRLGQEK